MKKNGQYVGVDEKFIPEEEKFADNNLNDEINNDIYNVYMGAKEYVSDKDNQKKMKNVGQIAKGISIGYLAFTGIVFVMAIVIFAMLFTQFFKINKQSNQIADNFNFEIELYNGTHYGSTVTSILDKVVTKMKKNSDHLITVVYNSTMTSKTDEITSLKKQLDVTAKYEVSIDYDSNGFINKITISDY